MFKIKTILLLLIVVFNNLTCKAQKDSLSTASLLLGQDSFFGFYVSGAGSYSIDKNKSITFYTNYWTNPAFGNATAGTDFWTEIGGGINFSFADNKLNLNPSLGVTYGKVLSGGERGVLGDGIIPALFGTYKDDGIESTAGICWYKALRKTGPANADYIWAWIDLGLRMNKQFSTGGHFEELYLSRSTSQSQKPLFVWIGPYLQYAFNNNVTFKAIGGYDTCNKSFAKITIYIPLINN